MANAPSNLGMPPNQNPNQSAPAPGSAVTMVNGHQSNYNSPAGSASASASASASGSGSNSAPNSSNGANQPSANNNPNSIANNQNLLFPALHLHPLNDTFAPKQISLSPPGPNNRIKIGRQTNAKTIPNPSNGYFDSKVLSRMHAEIWCQDGKVFIKDVRSSNGTFINGERLSAEAQESDVFELHNEDMVEFGIDIIGDDSKTIIHHKVACRVYLVITAEDALGLRNDFASLYRGGVHGGPLGSNGVGPGAEGGLRRGKAGFSFDHVFSKLQSELQKSKDTWNDLGNLNATMNDIHDTLGGGLPPITNPPYQHMVPQLPAPSHKDPQSQEATDAAAKQHAQTIAALQSQLSETQASLASHVDKIKSLEGMLAEHESIKAEVGLIKVQMEQAKREMEQAAERQRFTNGLRSLDFDDGASVASMDTITAGDSDRHADDDGHVGPLAPPDMPPGMEPEQQPQASQAASKDRAAPETEAEAISSKSAVVAVSAEQHQELKAQNAALTARLEELSSQLEQALELSRNLQTQHTQVTDTVKQLEARVQTLEQERATARWAEWKAEMEEGWRKERESWASEREELHKLVKAWDEARPARRRRKRSVRSDQEDGGDALSEDDEQSIAESTSTRPSTATGITSPDVEIRHSPSKASQRHGHEYHHPAAIPIPAVAAGVVVVGVAAWVLAGGGNSFGGLSGTNKV